MKKVLLLITVCMLMLPLAAGAEALRLPENTKTIGEEAFMNTSLDEVILPEGLLTIGSRAFAGSSVRVIYLPASIEEIADDAFEDCVTTGWGQEGTYAAAFFDEKENLTFSGRKPLNPDIPASLLEAAQAEGKVVLFGSAGLMSAAAERFEELYGIEVECIHTDAASETTKVNLMVAVEESIGDVWFYTNPARCGWLAEAGVLDNSYSPVGAAHLANSAYRDSAGYWWGIFTDFPGFVVNKEKLTEMGLPLPETWDDLLKPEYMGLILLPDYQSNFGHSIVNYICQLKGHDEGVRYLSDLFLNALGPVSYSTEMINMAANGDRPIAIYSMLSAARLAESNGYDSLQLILPGDGTAFSLTSVVLFAEPWSASHPNAAGLFLEFLLSPDFVDLAYEQGLSIFPVIDNANPGGTAAKYGLDLSLVGDVYDPGKDLSGDDLYAYLQEIWAAIDGTGE